MAEASRRVVLIADELCVALDNAAEDIGGSRPVDTIIKELGPAVDRALDSDNAAGQDYLKGSEAEATPLKPLAGPEVSSHRPDEKPVPAAPMPIDTAPGTAVRYAYPKNGGGYEGKRAEALGIRVGDVLTVDCTDIHRSSTTLYLREFPGEPFNTVNFALSKEELTDERE